MPPARPNRGGKATSLTFLVGFVLQSRWRLFKAALFVIVAGVARHYQFVNIALASLLILASPAVSTSVVGLAYDSPDGCPTQQEFVTAVAGRGANFDGARESKRTMVVSIHKQDDGFAGAFQVRDDQGETNKREVHGASCGEVAEALAVVTAIALRPAGEAPPAKSALDATTPQTGKLSSTPPELRLRGSTRYFPPRSESVPVGAGNLRFDFQRSFTAYAGANVGMIGSMLMPRYDLSAVIAHFITTPEGVQRISGLVTQLRISGLGPGTYRSADTTTDVAGLSFGLGICQSPLYDTRGWVVLFCGEYGGGFVNFLTKDADGKQIQSKIVGFGSVNLGTEVQYNFGSVFHIGAKVGGGFSFGQFSAERADGSRIFGSSSAGLSWSAYGLLGAGVHF
jgi:hypothetical protein